MKKYIARPGTWFKAGTEAVLIEDLRPMVDAGVFRGTCVTPTDSLLRGIPPGAEVEDEEVCAFDEFDVIETEQHP